MTVNGHRGQDQGGTRRKKINRRHLGTIL
jgi:hypothetical protein